MSLHVNFTDQEASSEARDFTPIPSGWYHVALTDGSIEECGPESKNAGKPYWKVELTVQDGPYENRKVFSNVMLFDGALYSLSQLLKACGYDVESGTLEVPTIDELIGKTFEIRVKVQAATEKYDARNDVKGFRVMQHASGVSTGSSMLP